MFLAIGSSIKVQILEFIKWSCRGGLLRFAHVSIVFLGVGQACIVFNTLH